MIPLTPNETAVLSALEAEGGSATVRQMREHLSLSESTTYRILRRLNDRGVVGAEWNAPDSAFSRVKPHRTYYLI